MKNSNHIKMSCSGCIYLKQHPSIFYRGIVEICTKMEGFESKKEGELACYESGKAKAFIKNR